MEADLPTPLRGRLNVLANVCRKELHKLFNQFDPALEPEDEVLLPLPICDNVVGHFKTLFFWIYFFSSLNIKFSFPNLREQGM